jgi:NADPH-dependent glutamate synthase beta subunit-like oxidoreductase/NAD(P)H-flavin reductase
MKETKTNMHNASSSAFSLSLAFGMSFPELYQTSGLQKLDHQFLNWLGEAQADLKEALLAARANPYALEAKKESELLLELAPYLEDFIARLFGIEKEMQGLAAIHHSLAPLYACKRLFVQRRALKAVKDEAELNALNGATLRAELEKLFGEPFSELAYARHVMGWLEKEAEHTDALALAARYAAWSSLTAEGKHYHSPHHGEVSILFRQPRKLDPLALVPAVSDSRDGIEVLRLPKEHYRHREGFALTDDGGSLTRALDEANYCIYCHNQGKDSCSKGMKEKDGSFKKSALGITLNGCPLEEKISEMNNLKSVGVPLGALAVVTVDNPMCAGTGHRICNDCMKSCIYQKQDPVDIPRAETRTLKDVLELPWGFEIYSLLTRWNPLNLRRPLPRPDTGKKVLVAGLGPAGYTLAHHLLNDGHTVVGIDGLKIEPLPSNISGVDALGQRMPFRPIRDIAELRENLDDRTLSGFGGVAEYGITVRWDKNYLKIIRLLLERRSHFAMMGGVRFGSTLTIEQSWELGFNHIALCMGAGKPTVIDMPNGMARGVRTASDFLMALQLTGAAKKDSIANLQLRLPVVVIGGGLTAIDTATESLAYYPVQVEKFLSRYEALVAMKGEAAVRLRWGREETEIAEEFLAHGRAIRAERVAAKKEGREPDIWRLLDEWGGVKLVYRKKLIDAPCYRLNHEEVEKAFEEGIFIAENWEPAAIEVDSYGHAHAITLKSSLKDEDGNARNITLPARTVLVAAGTSPNTVLQREFPHLLELDGKYFRAVDEQGNHATPEQVAKPTVPYVLMNIAAESQGGKRAMSYFGDLHPSFAGNVVKAMGSAKQGYPVISRVLEQATGNGEATEAFLTRMNGLLRPTVHAVNRLTPTIIEVVVKAPLAAAHFEPGQFYRLQNFEANAMKVALAGRPTTLAMEGLALTGAWVDKEQGLLSTIVLEMGGSSDLCAYLKPGEPIILMGPTGEPTEIPQGETVLLAGGGLGNAVLFSIGKALKAQGSRVLYFAGYKKAADRYKVEEIEAASDLIIWCCDEEPGFTPSRAGDRAFVGNIVEAMRRYASGELGEVTIPFAQISRIIAIGSDRMMAAVKEARHGVLQPYLSPAHVAIGSINSPMQCMMKEICAQCLQEHIDPVTGRKTLVYSCFNQDQELDKVSFAHLNQRLKQNLAQEALTAQWIDACLKEEGLRNIAC